MSDVQDYALGYSQAEARRLAAQAAFFGELTEDVLRRAGLGRGMRVLDVGCGVGDVSLLAARMVGAEGSVLGVDRATSSLDIARQRAAAAGAGNVSFAAMDLAGDDPGPGFDAVIGRLILLYLPDPAQVLRRVIRSLRPGGIVAFQELDMSTVAQVPPCALFERTGRWIVGAFAAAGARVDMGRQLLATFRRAGLPWPRMIASTRVEAGPDSVAYDILAELVRSLLPVIERAGLGDRDSIAVDTLAERLRAEAVAHEAAMFLPPLVGAWTRLPGREGT